MSPNYRKEIVDALLPYARADTRLHLLVCDMGFGVIDSYREALPDRILNVGVMEQGTVGIAAGMAMSGLRPVVYSIVNFLAYRALEQVRNDVVLQNLGVKFIGTGANDYFKFLGHSHCCGADDEHLMKLIGMPVFDPYHEADCDFPRMVKDWLSSPGPAYIRV
ncbi:MAG: transketolase [Elusimicrobia bacterium]|nr:transketolase [Elusimicrobiota bacterium]